MSDTAKTQTEEITPAPSTGKLNQPATEPDELGESDLEKVSGGRVNNVFLE